MIKKLVLFVLFSFSVSVFASPVNVRFSDIGLPEFAYFVLTEIKPESFVMDDDFLATNKRLTVRFSDVEPDVIYSHLHKVLDVMGFRLVKNKGMVYITKQVEEANQEKEVFVYFPKYRTPDYLMEVSGTVVNPQGFSVSRAVKQSDKGNFESSEKQSVNDNVTKKNYDVLVYNGTSKDVSILESLLKQIDLPYKEIVVKAMIYEVRTETSDNNAVQIAAGLIDSARGLGVSLVSGAVDLKNALRIRVKNVDSALSIFSGDARFSVISTPTLRIRHGEHARMEAGAEVPVLSGVTYNGNGQTVQSIQYRASGVILDLLPEIHEQDIGLTITHQLSSFQATSSGVNQSPTLLKREIKTSVTVQDDELVILGGLDETQKNVQKKGLSFLPDFFRGESNDSRHSEILLVLHVKRI